MYQYVDYQVFLPTGGHVEINERQIVIKPTAHDREKTQGLCGTFNSDCTDDFELRDGSDYGDVDADASRTCGQQNRRFSPNTYSNDWR